jgi:Aerotolerance regulator N-terminal
MILLNSIWLFALAALSIPVAIHLWNIRPGKTLKVGSIALIHTSAQKSSRSFKLHDLLLLSLRCLLLVLVAFVLGVPVWQKYIDSSSVKGWVLISRENLKESYQKFKPQIDSLTKAGYEFHYFNKGFSKAELNEVIADAKNTKLITDTNNASYWSLVQQLDRQIPASIPVYLFTPNGAIHFSGVKPQVSLNLHWQTFIPADSAKTWIAKAWLGNNNDVQVVQGNSTPRGTYYTNYTIRSVEQHNTPFLVNASSGRLSAGLKNSDQKVIVDTSTWRFAIYTEKATADAGYLKAALESIVQFTKHKSVIKQYTDAGQIPAHQNWIFWLSQKPINGSSAQNCDNLWRYEAGKIMDVNSSINDGERSLSTQNIALYRSVIGNTYGQMLWHDGFSNPVLSLERHQHTNTYHFYGRFDPSWNNLVWSDDFPKMLLRLIVDDPGLNNKYDRRVTDQKQLLPLMDKGAHATTGKITDRIDLSHYAWLVLVLIFVMERWLAHKKASKMAGKQILQNG